MKIEDDTSSKSQLRLGQVLRNQKTNDFKYLKLRLIHFSLSSFHFHLFNLLPLSPTFVKNFNFISFYQVFITQKETFLIPYRYKLLTI